MEIWRLRPSCHWKFTRTFHILDILISFLQFRSLRDWCCGVPLILIRIVAWLLEVSNFGILGLCVGNFHDFLCGIHAYNPSEFNVLYMESMHKIHENSMFLFFPEILEK